MFNSNSRIMVAALKFFLGQDEATGDDSDDDNDEEDIKAVQPTKAEMYKANSKVSLSTRLAQKKSSSCQTQSQRLCRHSIHHAELADLKHRASS